MMEIRFSIPSLRTVLLALAVGLLVFAGYCAYEFRAERQLSKVFDRMITAVEARDWKRVQSLMADDYLDAWKMNRTQATQIGSEVLKHFIVLSIRADDPVFAINHRAGSVKSKIELSGNGSAIAQAVMSAAAEFSEPFKFTWTQETWAPWSWKLTCVSHPEVQFDPSYLY
jgi:hypothetical protein